ncbi:MAG: glycosyltransferase [Firmicutes bacterium]|nr:glycosyltransferase [Bacillota bacterium]MBQ2311732.1 glycosyltransferase [Bacillota bacterium]
MDLKVCLLNDSFPPIIDGVANAVVNYAEIIKANGGTSLVVTPDNPDADDSGFDFPVYRYPGIDARKIIGYMAGYPFSPATAKKIKNSDIDILHSHCPIASNIFARSMKGIIDVPLIMTYHTKFDIEIEGAIRGKLLQDGAVNALVESISACDEVWVVSEGAGRNLRSMGYEGDYIVMPNGADMPLGRLPEKEVRKLTAELAAPEGVPVYLFVGRLMWYKGIKTILDALAGVRSQGMDFRMVFVGGGQDADEIKAYTKKLALDDKVLFCGPVRDRKVLQAWYCRADMFLFPSDFDTNGLVVREAAACSLPAALLKGSCAAEGVTNGRNGFLTEDSAASLAVLLATKGRDRRLLRRAGECAAAELYLSWPDAVSKAIERYNIVSDRYKAGLYPKKTGPLDAYLSFQGTLMDLFAPRSDEDD